MKLSAIKILTIVYFIASCKTHDRIASSPVSLSLQIKQHLQHNLLSSNEIFSKMQLVPLSVRDSTPLVSISKVIIYKSRYYVLDQNFSQLYSFDERGNQLVKFGDVGLAPNQLKKFSDFDILGDQLAILSNNDKAINFYNVYTGKFLRRLYIDLFGNSLSLLSADKTLVFINQNRNEKSDNYNICLIDSTGSIKDRFFQFNKSDHSIVIAFSGFLSKTNNNIYFSSAFSNVVYKYNNGKFLPYLDAGVNSENINSENDNLINIAKETKMRDLKTSFLSNVFLKSDNHIVTTFQDSLILKFCFYNIKTKSFSILKKAATADPLLRLMNSPQFISQNGEIVFNVSPGTVHYLKTSLPEVYANLSDENKQILSHVNKNSSQLLMVCQLK